MFTYLEEREVRITKARDIFATSGFSTNLEVVRNWKDDSKQSRFRSLLSGERKFRNEVEEKGIYPVLSLHVFSRYPFSRIFRTL
jgi:hypothetical protein